MQLIETANLNLTGTVLFLCKIILVQFQNTKSNTIYYTQLYNHKCDSIWSQQEVVIDSSNILTLQVATWTHIKWNGYGPKTYFEYAYIMQRYTHK